MSSNAFPSDRQGGLRSILVAACTGLSLGLLAAGSVAAQAPMPSPQSAASAPGMSAAMQSPTAAATARAYEEMEWTGRPAAPAIQRKEARAALVAGRRHCTTLRAPGAREDCLRVVQEDYREMLAGMQSRSARR